MLFFFYLKISSLTHNSLKYLFLHQIFSWLLKFLSTYILQDHRHYHSHQQSSAVTTISIIITWIIIVIIIVTNIFIPWRSPLSDMIIITIMNAITIISLLIFTNSKIIPSTIQSLVCSCICRFIPFQIPNLRDVRFTPITLVLVIKEMSTFNV